MRITAGKHQRRRIEVPDGKGVRPTSSIVRESVFNILTHAEPAEGDDHLLLDQPVADICCGCGTMGLEALSRNAGSVTFIDQNRTSLDYTKHNAEHLGETANSTFIKADATQLPIARHPVSVVFLDPPYRENMSERIIRSLLRGNWLKKGGVLALEIDIIDPLPEIVELEEFKNNTYGKTRLICYRYV